MFGRLQDWVGDLDRAAIVAGQEVRPRELTAEGDHRRLHGQIGELGGGGLQERERILGARRL